jgi:hypothetical protein
LGSAVIIRGRFSIGYFIFSLELIVVFYLYLKKQLLNSFIFHICCSINAPLIFSVFPKIRCNSLILLGLVEK